MPILALRNLLTTCAIVVMLAACAAPDPPVARSGNTGPEIETELTLSPDSADRYADQRERMVEEQIATRGIDDEDVLRAMRTVPRHRFVPEDLIGQAYADHPLPIGYGQTISQPYIVALMSEALQVQPGDKVLEIGTGSAYQAAVLGALGAETYTMEIVPELAEQAQTRLTDLGLIDVHARQGDGYFGWEEFAPFDAIIVTAAPDHLPQPLANQLTENGRLVVPIGPVGAVQTLWLFEKTDGELQATNMGGVRFVPFTRE